MALTTGATYSTYDPYPDDFNKYYGNDWSGSSTTTFITPSKEIEDWLSELRRVEFLTGGKSKDWIKIKKIAQKWLDKAIEENLLGKDIKIKRVSKDFTDDNVKMFSRLMSVFMLRPSTSPDTKIGSGGNSTGYVGTDWGHTGGAGGTGYVSVTTGSTTVPDSYNNWRFNSSTGVVTPSLIQYPDMIIRDVVTEKMSGEESYACIEAEVLRGGGVILGKFEDCLAVYFPFYHEIAMEKLLEDGEENPDFYTTMSGIPTGTYSAYPTASSFYTQYTAHTNPSSNGGWYYANPQQQQAIYTAQPSSGWHNSTYSVYNGT